MSSQRDAITQREGADVRLKPVLDGVLRDFNGGIGKVIRVLVAWPEAEAALTDIADDYMDYLPEEITARIKVVLDILGGNDGVIYRD